MSDPAPPLDLDDIAERHQPATVPLWRDGRLVPGVYCTDDVDPWPCDAYQLLVRVRALEAVAVAVRALIDDVSPWVYLSDYGYRCISCEQFREQGHADWCKWTLLWNALGAAEDQAL